MTTYNIAIIPCYIVNTFLRQTYCTNLHAVYAPQQFAIVLSLYDLLCSISTPSDVSLTSSQMSILWHCQGSQTLSGLIQISDTGNGSIHLQMILFPKIAIPPSQLNDSFLHFLARSGEHKSIECFHNEAMRRKCGAFN